MGCGASAKSAYEVNDASQPTQPMQPAQPQQKASSGDMSPKKLAKKVSSGDLSSKVSSKKSADDAKIAFKGSASKFIKSCLEQEEQGKVTQDGTPLPRDSRSLDESALVIPADENTFTKQMSPISENETLAARASGDYEKYKNRKEQRKVNRQKKASAQGNSFIPRNGFLSNVPEMDSDVQYRFAFIVICDFADKVVKSVCNCSEAGDSLLLEAGVSDAQMLPAFEEDDQPNTEDESPITEDESPISRRNSLASNDIFTGGVYRCVCPVPYPRAATDTGIRKFAKLVFRPLTFSQKVPTFDGALEASNTAFVFIIVADPADDAPPLQQQLDSLLKTVKVFKRSPKELRPKWAVIVCHSTSRKEGADPGSPAIDNFERLHGPLWRFGSGYLEEPDTIYGSFAKIASQRIYINQNPEADLDDASAKVERDSDSDSGGAGYGAERDDFLERLSKEECF